MISTAELVARFEALGYKTSPEMLRQDVLHGLVSPSMPGYDRPGRGRLASWSPAAIRRVLYLSRLRRLGVDGRALPMLAFLRDGWGWRYIAPDVARHLRRSALLDLRAIRASLIKSQDDLEDRAAQPSAEDADAYTGTMLEARKYVLSVVAHGVPDPGSSVSAFASDLVAEMGVLGSKAELAAAEALGERIADARRAWGLGPRDLPGWIEAVEDEVAERGREWLQSALVLVRRQLRAFGLRRTNPLTWCGADLSAIRTLLRAQTGRPTVAQLLAESVGQAIYAAELLHRIETPRQ